MNEKNKERLELYKKLTSSTVLTKSRILELAGIDPKNDSISELLKVRSEIQSEISKENIKKSDLSKLGFGESEFDLIFKY